MEVLSNEGLLIDKTGAYIIVCPQLRVRGGDSEYRGKELLTRVHPREGQVLSNL